MKTVDLFLFMGQSNMAGRAAPAAGKTVFPAPQCIPGAGYEFRAASVPTPLWPAAEPFGFAENDPDGIWEPGRKKGSLVTAFINAYYAGTGVPVVGVSASRGGSAIAEWEPGTPFFEDAVRRLQRAGEYLEREQITIRHRYLLWCQGETDGERGTLPEDYIAAFSRVLDGLSAHGVEHCFLIRIGHFNQAADPAAPPQDYRAIIETQNRIARDFDNVTLVSSGFTSMRDAGQMPDVFHYTQHAYNEIGTEAGANAARFVRGNEMNADAARNIRNDKMNADDARNIRGDELNADDARNIRDDRVNANDARNIRGDELNADDAQGVCGSEYLTPFPMKHIPEPTFPDAVFSAADYSGIATAVEACARAGGGTVEVPPGRHETGPIRLYSKVRLHLALGAVLVFDPRPEAYLPPVFTRWEGTECYNYQPLVYAVDAEDVAICGDGSLVGNGQSWWGWKTKQGAAANALYDMAAAGISPEKRVFGTTDAALRPSFVQFLRCKRVLVEGIALIDGPQWTLHPVYCSDVIVRRIRVHTDGPNTDGLNPDSCRNVLIEDSTFFTGDDCIAVNAGLNEDGWRVDIPCENIVVRRCTMTGGHGGIVIGSAISGGVKNVCAYDCDISGTMQGLRLKSMRGRGGCVKNVGFRNIRIHNVSDAAIQINMFYEFSTVMPKTDAPSTFRKICFSDISGRGAQTAVELKGLPEHHLQDITLEQVHLTAKEGLRCTDADGLYFSDVVFRQEDNKWNRVE